MIRISLEHHKLTSTVHLSGRRGSSWFANFLHDAGYSRIRNCFYTESYDHAGDGMGKRRRGPWDGSVGSMHENGDTGPSAAPTIDRQVVASYPTGSS